MNSEDDSGWPAAIAIVVIVVLVVVAKFILADSQPSGASTNLSDEQVAFRRAVDVAVWPDHATVAHDLVGLKPTDTLATWTSASSLDCFKQPKLCKFTWVTVHPHLQQFCQQFVKANGADQNQLNLRLKQRLGLPPDASYDTFVEFTVAAADFSKIFRPCGTWDPSTSTCPEVKGGDVWNPSPGINREALDWVVKNHYSSYATDQPYPWTALGYTFDWSRKSDAGNDFVREGESEFAVPKDVAIKFVSATPTVNYCKTP